MILVPFFFVLPGLTSGFLPMAITTQRHTAVLHAVAGKTDTNEDVIRRLRQEYHDLQDELFVYLAFNDKDAASELSEEMLAKAADLNTVERYNQVLKVKQYADELKHAKEDLELAEEILSKAHIEALTTDFKTHHVDSMDQVFDTTERERATKAAEDARSAEEFAKEILLDAQFEELQAELDYDNAEALLQDLVENSQMLERSLDRIKYEHELAQHWAEEEMPKHKEFLSTARHVIRSGKLIDHDPFKGDIAF